MSATTCCTNCVMFVDVRAKLSRPACTRTVSNSRVTRDRKSTRLNSSHANISYAVFCLKKNTYLANDARLAISYLFSSHSLPTYLLLHNLRAPYTCMFTLGYVDLTLRASPALASHCVDG